MQSSEADDVSFYTCNFGLSVAVPYYLGTIHILRQHIFGRFWNHPLCQHKYSTERQQKITNFWTHPPVLT